MALRRARTSSRCFSFARCAFSCRLRSREVEYEEEGESLTGRLEAAVDEAPAAAASPSRAALSRYTFRLGASSSMSLLMRSMASVRTLQAKRHDVNRTEERERGACMHLRSLLRARVLGSVCLATEARASNLMPSACSQLGETAVSHSDLRTKRQRTSPDEVPRRFLVPLCLRPPICLPICPAIVSALWLTTAL